MNFPYKWTLRMIPWNISWIFHSIVKGIKNLIRWAPVIWDDEDFDWEYLAKIMKVKMRWMSSQAHEWGGVDNEKMARELLICAELLKRLRGDDISDSRFWYIHHTRMKEWQQMLGRMIGKHLRCWWD